jgi:hypothetical protein
MDASDLSTSEFGRRLGSCIQKHMTGRSAALRRLAAGAAFETWFAFESRLAVEDAREALGLDAPGDYQGQAVKRYWTANEYRKVDLYVGDVRGNCLAAIEFKLIHNNKNWGAKCEEVWADLYPTGRSRKEELAACARHLVAVPIMVFKCYWHQDGSYPGQEDNEQTWRKATMEHLLQGSGKHPGKVDSMFASERFSPLVDEYLADAPTSYVEFRVLVRAAAR